MCKLAIIGCGNIAKFHVPAMKAAGFDVSAISGRPGTADYLNSFAREFNLTKAAIFNDPYMLLASDNWDALLLSCPTNFTLRYIRIAIKKSKPILAEKPVSLRSSELREFFKHQNIKVAYNRRFYNVVEYAKEFLTNNEISLVKVTIPESSDEKFNAQFFPERLPIKSYENSVHVVDLLRYLFGDIRWTHHESITNGTNYKALIGIGKSKAGINILLDSCFNSSDNFGIQIISNSKRLELKPLESARLFDGMKIVSPSCEVPVRRYLPDLKYELVESDESNMKLGFARQAEDFRGFCNGNESRAATIYDSYKALELIERLKS